MEDLKSFNRRQSLISIPPDFCCCESSLLLDTGQVVSQEILYHRLTLNRGGSESAGEAGLPGTEGLTWSFVEATMEEMENCLHPTAQDLIKKGGGHTCMHP